MFYIIFILIVHSLSSQNIWEERLNNRETEFRSTPVSLNIRDSNTVYFVTTAGNDYFLFKSIDKGKNWDVLHSFSKYSIQSTRSMSIVDSNVFIGFAKGIILKSTDDGKSFTKIDLGYNNFVEEIIMFDENFGIACMPLKTYRTFDSWKTFDTLVFPFNYSLFVLTKKNRTNIIGIINEFFYDSLSVETNFSNYRLHFIDLNVETNDYSLVKLPKCYYSDIEILKDSTYCLVGKRNAVKGGSGHDFILKSTDAGNTWRTVLDLYADYNKISTYPFGLQEIAFKNDSVGIAVGQFGKILYTYDSGESWIYEQQNPKIIDSLSTPTLLIEYAGDDAILCTFNGQIYTLKEDNLMPKAKDTLTLSGKIISEDSLAISGIPIRLNNSRITMTDNEGNYEFTKLASGTYTVTALNKYFDGPNPIYYYEPYFYSSSYSIELSKDTTGIDFDVEKNDVFYNFSGRVLDGDEGVGKIYIQLNNIENGKIIDKNISILTTDANGKFYTNNLQKGEYRIIPISREHDYTPKIHIFNLDRDIDSLDFQIGTTSVSKKESFNFDLRNNVLYSKEIAGCSYRVIDLQGRVIKSSNLSQTIDFNYLDNGTYILQVMKNNSEVFSEKFQVVR